ncbi:50S ribosomal protein L24e [Sulfodiicoccus acidiphilus]|uniref:Large ribosomal subunit protein eL24 n=1 Tax=Sulfodiicoccus acidiphilus TaxID=1670455 RepID=A0A348B0D5_9CREN|nr:50S ribosomal protein L24e [Sulfodiicoccus acidiphilus]BBD71637.1 50S ribosomal protein L24e [Sulfodiicoccus acidiphilus]GGT86940.1 50S ribosomal protein L24e [Sulfodiicoccus acidiphilus]
MVAIRNCSFCGHQIAPGTGLMHIKNDGTILWFCSSRCRKYMLEYGKDPKKLKWTKFYTKVR